MVEPSGTVASQVLRAVLASEAPVESIDPGTRIPVKVPHAVPLATEVPASPAVRTPAVLAAAALVPASLI
jgi:hypothetical protein